MVDIVLNSVGGATIIDSIDLTRNGGTVVILGRLAGSLVELPIRRVYIMNLNIKGAIVSTGGEAFEALKVLESGAIKPVIGARLRLWSASEAPKLLEEGRFFR